MAHINVIEPEDADGELKQIYNDLIQKRGKLAEVHKIQSLNPESIVRHMDFYMTIMFGKSPLKRYQREMMAVGVSATNKCEYCCKHHGAALQNFWQDASTVDHLQKDYNSLNLSPLDNLICEYAIALTNEPETMAKSRYDNKLRQQGLSDRAILDATMVGSYFNFVNRMVLGLGVEVEDDEGKGYNY
ncbi:MAG: peroxidase [Bacteroidetes bacterium SW_11_45_7]|nr:MAG: peroxidase [Bacteroidetes bacterium SW_11_45_7]